MELKEILRKAGVSDEEINEWIAFINSVPEDYRDVVVAEIKMRYKIASKNNKPRLKISKLKFYWTKDTVVVDESVGCIETPGKRYLVATKKGKFYTLYESDINKIDKLGYKIVMVGDE